MLLENKLACHGENFELVHRGFESRLAKSVVCTMQVF